MKDIIKVINEIYDWLNINKELAKVYNQKYNNNNLKNVVLLSNTHSIDVDYVINNMRINVEYLLQINDKDSSVPSGEIVIALKEFKLLLESNNKYEFEDNDIYLLIKTNAMLAVYCCISIKKGNIDEIIDNNNNFIGMKKGNVYYRGHSDYSYDLIPSIYRDIKIKDELFDYQKLYEIYKNTNMLDKYERIFNKKIIDYMFCAYMQHSKSFSPLLDFTSDYLIALSFATTNYGKHINSYLKKDCALIEIKINNPYIVDNEKEATDSIKDLDVYISSKKLDVLSIIRGKPIYYCTYHDFETKALLLNTTATNDRMRYQKGSFLLFTKCVIINGIIMMPMDFGYIKKYRISSKRKIEIYELIKKYKNEYDYDHLMNPYLFFDESPL